MIPSVEDDIDLTEDIDEETEPSLDYKLHISEGAVSGKTDELDAMHQVIYKILNTERYENIIYSWDYGVELKDLFGMPVSYCCPEIERRITEALTQDDRIDSVDNFKFDVSTRHKIRTTFTVHTIFGDTDEESEVDY